jgi:predicted dehydrogenase/threonine dehydrogenase-like Zn-dependent dehydrogenase
LKQVVQKLRDGQLVVADVPAPTAGPGQLLVRTRTSLISAGTERATIEFARKSLTAKAASRMDLVSKVIAKARVEGVHETLRMVRARLNAPVALGYSCAGEVLEVGESVDGFRIGDRVACAGQNYASHAEFVCIPKNLCVHIPDKVSYADAAYVTLGAIALQGVRQAAPALSECVAVIGLGLLGQLTMQLLRANGCQVIGCDLSSKRRALAMELGAHAVADPNDLVAVVEAETNSYGADAVIITAGSKSDEPMKLAADVSRKKGRIAVVGAVPMNLPREPFYFKELELRLSMSYGPGRYDPSYEESGLDYPIAYVRWSERRNMAAFLNLIRNGQVNVDKVTTHRFDVSAAPEAYGLITGGQESVLGVLLNYDENADPETKRILAARSAGDHAVTLGVIGAGSHVTDRLLPELLKIRDVDIRAVCTANGRTAESVASRFTASYATTKYEDVLDDPRIRAVMIGTRHDLHARIAIAALARGKHVFVEKPLCLADSELGEICAAYEKAAAGGVRLFVGYNRRYSTHLDAAKRFLGRRLQPLSILYRVNAGALESNHWLLDEAVGGGRIIGEGCHFVDFLQAICDAAVESVFATAPAANGNGARNEASLVLQLADGSVGTIVYTGAGDGALPKERCEIHGEGKSVVIDDFRSTELYHRRRRRIFKTRRQDKGFANEMAAFTNLIREPDRAGQSFEAIHAASLATFRAVDSVKSGLQYQLRPAPITVVNGHAD